MRSVRFPGVFASESSGLFCSDDDSLERFRSQTRRSPDFSRRFAADFIGRADFNAARRLPLRRKRFFMTDQFT
ncbi:MAG: hypothetical protein IJO06_10575 [Thermoguttaceae bacterium]|nr:hypothetical protein [Thermoguttaceae bacterium]